MTGRAPGPEKPPTARSAAKGATSPRLKPKPAPNAPTKPTKQKQTVKLQPPMGEDKRPDKISADWRRSMSTRARMPFFLRRSPRGKSFSSLFLYPWPVFSSVAPLHPALATSHSSQSALRALTATTNPRRLFRNPVAPARPGTTRPSFCRRRVTRPAPSTARPPFGLPPWPFSFSGRNHVWFPRAFSSGQANHRRRLGAMGP